MAVLAEPAARPLRLATWHAGEGAAWLGPASVGSRPWTPIHTGVAGKMMGATSPTKFSSDQRMSSGAQFFNRGDVFRRRRFNGCGDRNHFMVVNDETMQEWLRGARFPDSLGKLLPRPYLTARAIARALIERRLNTPRRCSALASPSASRSRSSAAPSTCRCSTSRARSGARPATRCTSTGRTCAYAPRSSGSPRARRGARGHRAFGVPPSRVRKRTPPADTQL